MDNILCSHSPASALIVQNCVDKDQPDCKRDGGWSVWQPWPTPDPNRLFLNRPNTFLSLVFYHWIHNFVLIFWTRFGLYELLTKCFHEKRIFNLLQLNEYQTDPYLLLLSQNMATNCLFTFFFPVLAWIYLFCSKNCFVLMYCMLCFGLFEEIMELPHVHLAVEPVCVSIGHLFFGSLS